MDSGRRESENEYSLHGGYNPWAEAESAGSGTSHVNEDTRFNTLVDVATSSAPGVWGSRWNPYLTHPESRMRTSMNELQDVRSTRDRGPASMDLDRGSLGHEVSRRVPGGSLGPSSIRDRTRATRPLSQPLQPPPPPPHPFQHPPPPPPPPPPTSAAPPPPQYTGSPAPAAGSSSQGFLPGHPPLGSPHGRTGGPTGAPPGRFPPRPHVPTRLDDIPPPLPPRPPHRNPWDAVDHARPSPAPPSHNGTQGPPDPIYDPASLGWAQYIGREIRLNFQNAFKDYHLTVQDTINTSVISLEDRLLGKLAAPSSKQNSEEDEVPAKRIPSRRVRRKRTEDENNYHSIMRGWLADKGLKRTGTLPPLPPKQQEIAAFFNYRQGPGPSAEAPRFDWNSQFSSEWNSILLLLLSEEWIEFVSTVPGIDRENLEPEFFVLGGVRKILTTKLREVRKSFFQQYDPQTEMMDSSEQGRAKFERRRQEEMEKSRHSSRLHGTFLRRSKIVQHNQDIGVDAEFWDAAEELLDALGEQGMSSDESEPEQPTNIPYGRKRKVVRRIPRRWLAHDIALVWKHVESFYDDLPARQRRGNLPYDRIFEAKDRPDSFIDPASVVQNLPVNWYNQLWWKTLLPVRRSAISTTPPEPFPDVPMRAPIP